MTSIRPLSADDAAALLEFERRNRAWFGSLVPDRGDAYFADFAARHDALLGEQQGGTARFWLVYDDVDVLVGRVNLVDITGRTAESGYRIGREHTGLGHAKAAVALALGEAAALGVRLVDASTTRDNIGSQRVLSVSGFLAVERDPQTLDVNGEQRPAVHFVAHLQEAGQA